MQAVEGLTRLIRIADAHTHEGCIDITDGSPEALELQQDQLAVSICQAMLNTALPVAKYRVFMKIESGRETGREFTICAVNIEDVVAALYPFTQMSRLIYVTLWEQRATGADMLEAYQGPTRGSAKRTGLRGYLEGLRKYSISAMAN